MGDIAYNFFLHHVLIFFMKTCVSLIAVALLFCVSPSIPVSLKASGLVEPPDHCVVGITPQDYRLFLQDPLLEEIFELTFEQEGKVPLIPQDFYEEKMTSDPRTSLINGSGIDHSTIGLAIYRLGVPGDYSYVVQEEESSQKLAPMSGQATSLTWMSISDATYYATYAHRALGELPDGFLKMDPLLKTSYTTFSPGKSGSFSKPQENTEEQQQSIDDHMTWITGLLIGGGLLLGGGAYVGLRMRNPALHQGASTRTVSLNTTEKRHYRLGSQGWLVQHPNENNVVNHTFTYEQFKYTTLASSRVSEALSVVAQHFFKDIKILAIDRPFNTQGTIRRTFFSYFFRDHQHIPVEENSPITLSPVLSKVQSDFLENRKQHVIQANAYQHRRNKRATEQFSKLEERLNILNSSYGTKLLANLLFFQKFNDLQSSPHKIEREIEKLENVYKCSKAFGLAIQRAQFNLDPEHTAPLEPNNWDALMEENPNPFVEMIRVHSMLYNNLTSALKATSQECTKSARNQELVDICLEGLDFYHKSIVVIDDGSLFSSTRTPANLGITHFLFHDAKIRCLMEAGKAAFLSYQELAREDPRPNIREARRKAYRAASKRTGLRYRYFVYNYQFNFTFQPVMNLNPIEYRKSPAFLCEWIHKSYNKAANYYAQEHPNEELANKYDDIGSYFEKALQAYENGRYEEQFLWLEAGCSAYRLQEELARNPPNQQLISALTINASDHLHRAENFNTGERTCLESTQRFFNHLRLSFLHSIPPASTRWNIYTIIGDVYFLAYGLCNLVYYINYFFFSYLENKIEQPNDLKTVDNDEAFSKTLEDPRTYHEGNSEMRECAKN